MKKTFLAVAALVAINTANAQGKVGVNTVNPQATFHVDGAKDNTSAMDATVSHLSNDVFITNEGRVGIGDKDFTYGGKQALIYQAKLLVNGPTDSYLENNWNRYEGAVYSNYPFHYNAFLSSRSRGTRSNPSYPITGDYLGGLIGRSASLNSETVGDAGAGLNMVASENHTISAKGTYMYFFTNPNGSFQSQERLRISENGNIGIGTQNPSAKLEVAGKIKATAVNFTGLPTYADDAAAGTGGLTQGDMYKTAAGELRIKL